MESPRPPTGRTIVNKAAIVPSSVIAPWVGASVHRASDPRTDKAPRSAYNVDQAGLQHLAFALGSAAEVEAASVWLDSHGVRRKPVSAGFTPGSRYVTFFDPDGIPLEFYYMDAVYADVYGVDIEPQ